MLKYIAILTMLIDHINAILYNRQFEIMTLIGRFAFPLFALMLVRNYIYYSRSFARYATRLFIFGLISQPIYMYSFGDKIYQLNIFFSLLAGLAFMYALDTKDYLLGFIALIISIYSDYSIIGLLLIISLYYTYKIDTILSYISLFIATVAIVSPGETIISPILFLFILLAKETLTNSTTPIYKAQPRPGVVTKYMFYAFYPLHILILGLLR